MKAVFILLVVGACVAYVATAGIEPVEVEAKAQAAETPDMPQIDGKLQPSKVQKRGLYGYGWGPGWGYGYGWGGHPGFYGGWGGHYGWGYGWGWGGYFY